MKKTISTFLTIALVSVSQIAKSQTFEWAKQMGGSSFEYGRSIAVDAIGNIYTTGFFYQTVDFDPGAGVYNLNSNGNINAFVSKLDAAGNFIWAKQIGENSSNYSVSIALDNSGNVYTTGRFGGTVDFDPSIGTYNLTSLGSDDIFISKLDSAGNFVWAKQIGGNLDDYGLSIALDTLGNIFTTGRFSSTVDFDPGIGTYNLTSVGNSDIFISKLDTAGNFVWAKQIGGNFFDEGRSIKIDASSNVYITGSFRDIVDFDPGIGVHNLTSISGADVFVSKLDASGNFIWAKQMGGISYEEGNSITVDALGNVYTTGYFEGTVDFDPSVGTYNLTSVGNYDIFISKLDASGNFDWAKQMGSIDDDVSYSIGVDAIGNIYTTGYFVGTVDFDPGVGTFNLTPVGNYDIFISKLDSSGNFIWAKQIGGTNGSAEGYSTVVDGSGNIYTTGHFYSTADFDPGVSTFNLTAVGLADIFVHKMSQCMLDVSTTTSNFTITANQAGATYQWLDCDNNYTPIIGKTSQSFTATANGNYAVEITLGSCIDTSACKNVSNVGFNEYVESVVSIYPNPTNGNVTIKLNNFTESVNYTITSIDGKLIKQANNITNNIFEIDLSNESKGIYFLSITSNNTHNYYKILKQ
jgi:hypothetical protein